MTDIVIFTGVILAIFCFGYRMARALLPVEDAAFYVAFALPFFSVANVIVVLLLGFAGIALTPASIFITFLLLGIPLSFPVFRGKKVSTTQMQIPKHRFGTVTNIFAIGILASATLYGFTHAVLLPTFHYDSATNWNMRSKIAYHEKTLSFSDEQNLVRKPHYPPLYHALQITAMQGQSTWKDPIANGMHFLLSVSAFASLFLCLRVLRGMQCALTGTALIAGIPLLAVHMAQGYADATLIQFAILSLISFVYFLESNNLRWLGISSIFVGACVLTKSEGLPFCVVPWGIMVAYYLHQSSYPISKILGAVFPAIMLTLLWIFVVILHDLPLSPHGSSDTGASCHMRNILEMSKMLFFGGSFGITWYMLAVFGPLVRKSTAASKGTMIWGAISFIGLLFVYGCTENDIYLLSGQSFDRQMLLPASLFILSSFISLIPARTTMAD